MTVRLEFGTWNAPAHGSLRCMRGVAKAVFAGITAIPLLFSAARATKSEPSFSRFSGGAPLLADAFARDTGKMSPEEFLRSYRGPRTERIMGTDVELANPDSSLRSLAAMYPVSESRAGTRHACTLVDGRDTFSVSTDLRKGAMRVTLRFKKENERFNVPVPGTRTFDASGFVRLVRSLPQNPEWAGLPVGSWASTKIFLDKIDGTDIRRAFFVPLDSQGRAVTALGSGRYLVYAVIFHAGCIADGRLKVLHEDGYSLPVADK